MLTSGRTPFMNGRTAHSEGTAGTNITGGGAPGRARRADRSRTDAAPNGWASLEQS